MLHLRKTFLLCAGLIITATQSGCNKTESQSAQIADSKKNKTNLQIILGSTRQGRTSDKIAHALKQFADKRADVTTEIVDLRDFDLPFLVEETFPSTRTIITDPTVKKWSDTITRGDLFIIVVPEYNAGYPGVLKNALDILYKEWNNKPVAFVGYSGGSSGGANAIAQLRQVTSNGLGMKPVATDIRISKAWQAINAQGQFVDTHIEQAFNRMVDQLLLRINLD